jgi:hypothetical protein|tara:strand:- start:61 stop:240 length:180 start_codon:yes stop_codon:yes gene_type:complete
MIYLIKVWDGMEKIFEGYSRTDPSVNKSFSAWTDKTNEQGTTTKVDFTPARYRLTYETA